VNINFSLVINIDGKNNINVNVKKETVREWTELACFAGTWHSQEVLLTQFRKAAVSHQVAVLV
jgi:hypothetical protein